MLLVAFWVLMSCQSNKNISSDSHVDDSRDTNVPDDSTVDTNSMGDTAIEEVSISVYVVAPNVSHIYLEDESTNEWTPIAFYPVQGSLVVSETKPGDWSIIALDAEKKLVGGEPCASTGVLSLSAGDSYQWKLLELAGQLYDYNCTEPE